MKFIIEKKTVTVTPDSGQSKVYGSADYTLTFELSETVATNGALSRNPGDDAGEYDIIIGTLESVSTNQILKLSTTVVKFTISKKTVTVTPDSGQSKIYSSADHP